MYTKHLVSYLPIGSFAFPLPSNDFEDFSATYICLSMTDNFLIKCFDKDFYNHFSANILVYSYIQSLKKKSQAKNRYKVAYFYLYF